MRANDDSPPQTLAGGEDGKGFRKNNAVIVHREWGKGVSGAVVADVAQPYNEKGHRTMVVGNARRPPGPVDCTS